MPHVDPNNIFPYDPRFRPLVAPESGIFDDPVVVLCINRKWLGHLDGVISRLLRDDAWVGEDAERYRAMQEILKLLAAFANGSDCMPFDPCCPETNELLDAIKVLNQTIVTNQVTMITNQTTIITNQNTQIDNDTTVIEQNYQNVITQITNQYQQHVANNYNTSILNQMLYDGTPQSIAPNIPEDANWNITDDESGNGALCAAIERYQNDIIYQRTIQFNSAFAAVALGAELLAGALTLATAGAAAPVGLAVTALVGVTTSQVVAWNNSVNDPEGRRKARCCMYDGLKDQPVTFETFKASMNDCGFEVGTDESNIAGVINGENQKESSYLAFLRMISEQDGGGSADNCDCGCGEELILEDFLGLGSTIIPVGNCIYRIIQNTEVGGFYYASIRDSLGRCLDINYPEGYDVQGVANSAIYDCSETLTYDGVGGFVPAPNTGKVSWRQGEPMDTYYKITLAVT